MERYLHVKVENVVPENLQRALLIIDFHRQPDVAALPNGVQVPLVSINFLIEGYVLSRPYLIRHVEIGQLLSAIDSPRKARLCAESSGVGGRYEKGLRPGARELIRTERHNVYD
jgi:hypothetical protein